MSLAIAAWKLMTVMMMIIIMIANVYWALTVCLRL